MFLYWRKRGAYELEALPGDLAELELGAVERFSWSSTLDIIEDLGGRAAAHSPRSCRWDGTSSPSGQSPSWKLLLRGEGPQREDPEGRGQPKELSFLEVV
ncbi:Hypothetical predicted protein [Marmota monax]|uniref:Uncharacterized protein n=1 Tax=Marmota monax TaxID=9995 RepID=A0A5E4AXR0_MARMO|nr:hypothetical protein GHT09_019593 [Marmota monax]VTJ61965.1 Hypothetical predicted protein [Marmota monax]